MRLWYPRSAACGASLRLSARLYCFGFFDMTIHKPVSHEAVSNLPHRTHTRKSAYGGIVTPLVTPLRDRDALDYAGLERLIDHQLSGGVHGLFLLGTTGEASALSAALKRELIRTAV